MTDSKITRFERTLLILWFVLNLGIGVLTVHEYGMSGDERNNYRYAADTLNAYPPSLGLFISQNMIRLMMVMGQPSWLSLAS